MDEVDLDPVDLGRELRQRVQPRLQSLEVVLGAPVAGEFLDRRQLDALRPIWDEFLARPARRGEALAQFVDLFLRNIDVEGANLGCPFDGSTHNDLFSSRQTISTVSGMRHAPGWRRAASAPGP